MPVFFHGSVNRRKMLQGGKNPFIGLIELSKPFNWENVIDSNEKNAIFWHICGECWENYSVLLLKQPHINADQIAPHSKVGHAGNSAMQQIGQCDKLVM